MRQVSFDVRGELKCINGPCTAELDDGLAAFAFDLTATLNGNSIDVSSAQVTAPSGDLDAFAISGLRNPAGFGGTPFATELIQIGGAQNTIDNQGGAATPFPIGNVVLHVANATPQVLANVSLQIPDASGYEITVGNGRATAIIEGESGPIYKVRWVDSVEKAVLNLADSGAPECLFRVPAWQCDGDVDGDGQVNPVDSGLVQAAFGNTDCSSLCSYDMDCDGQINPVDSGIVQSLFGTCNPPRDVCP